MEVVIFAIIMFIVLYVMVQLLKKHFNKPKNEGGFPYSRNRRNY